MMARLVLVAIMPWLCCSVLAAQETNSQVEDSVILTDYQEAIEKANQLKRPVFIYAFDSV